MCRKHFTQFHLSQSTGSINKNRSGKMLPLDFWQYLWLACILYLCDWKEILLISFSSFSLNLKIESMIFRHFHLDRNMLWKVILLLRNNLPNVSHYFTLSVTTRVSVGNHCMFQLKYLDNTNEEEKGSLFVNENCTVILVYNGEIHVNDCLSSILKKNSKKKKNSASRRSGFLPSSLNSLLSSLL